MRLPLFRGRVAVLGLGEAGMRHVAAVLRHPELQLAAIADPDERLCQQILQHCQVHELPLPAAHADAARLLEGARHDVIVVATPDRLHDAHVSAALSQGMHVLVESLASASVSQWDEAMRLADCRQCSLQIAAPWRRETSFLKFKQRLTMADPGPMRGTIACKAPLQLREESLHDSGGPVSRSLFPLLDALSCAPGDVAPALAFSTGSPLGAGSMKWGSPHTMASVIRTHGSMDVSLRYEETLLPPSSGPAAEVTLVWSGGQATCTLPAQVSDAAMDAMWSESVDEWKGHRLPAHPPHTFRSSLSLAHALLRAHTEGRTLCFPAQEPELLTSAPSWHTAVPV